VSLLTWHGAEVRKLPAQRVVGRDVLEHDLSDQIVSEREPGQGREDGVVGDDGLVDRQGLGLADRVAGVPVRGAVGVTVDGDVARRRRDRGLPRAKARETGFSATGGVGKSQLTRSGLIRT